MTLVTLSGQGSPLDELTARPTPLPTDLVGIAVPGSSTLYRATLLSVTGPIAIACQYLGAAPPLSSEVMAALIWPMQVIVPANFDGAYGDILVNPTATFVATVNKNASVIGGMSIATNGDYTFTTASGLPVTYDAGDSMTFTAPSGTDATAAGLFWTIIANPTGA